VKRRFIKLGTLYSLKEERVLSAKKEFSLNELNKPEDWDALPDMAKKHVPTVEAPARVKRKDPFTVKVKVGGIDGVEHPNTLGHWINWVDLYAGERMISRFVFAPEMCDGYVATLSVSLNETTTLMVQGFCNLHGVWEGKPVTITVE
jgi:superoxide reductase